MWDLVVPSWGWAEVLLVAFMSTTVKPSISPRAVQGEEQEAPQGPAWDLPLPGWGAREPVC